MHTDAPPISDLVNVTHTHSLSLPGLKHLFVSGLPPIKNVRLTYPKTADVSHSSYTPDQVGGRT